MRFASGSWACSHNNSLKNSAICYEVRSQKNFENLLQLVRFDPYLEHIMCKKIFASIFR